MSKSQEILAADANAYAVVRVADVKGRLLGVRRLRPSQQLRVEELSPGLSGTTEITDPTTGQTMELPKRMPLLMAASVCEIDERPVIFPRTRAELDSVLDMLDNDGLAAVAQAFSQMDGAKAQDTIEEAKNLQGTPRRGKP